MNISERDIEKIVEQVILKICEQQDIETIENILKEDSLTDGIFLTVDEAVNAANEAWEQLSKFSIEERDQLITAMRDAAVENSEYLAKLAVEETGLGRVEHKIEKNLLAARKTPGIEDLTSRTYTGDNGLTLVEYAPIGIIGSITPTTNPAATIINNSISMVAAGNVVVYNPHPNAKNVSIKAIQILNKAIVSAGGPENVLTATANPTLETSQSLMKHKFVKALVVTGGGAVVKEALTSGKKVIAAGPGNPPVVVDETADISQAGRDIVNGASFDNNVLCTAEKEVFVVKSVFEQLIYEIKANGAYELSPNELEKILNIVLVNNGNRYFPNKEFVGKNADYILQAAGISGDSSIKLLIAETNSDHPLVTTEMLMPIVPIVKVSSVDEAIKEAVVAEKGNRHTAIMHSKNIDNLTKMAKKIQTTIFVQNGPSYSGLGLGGEGFTTLTIAGPTGEGLTSAKTFTRQRRGTLVNALNIL